MIELLQEWHRLQHVIEHLRKQEIDEALRLLDNRQREIMHEIDTHERSQSEDRLEADCDVDRSPGHTG